MVATGNHHLAPSGHHLLQGSQLTNISGVILAVRFCGCGVTQYCCSLRLSEIGRVNTYLEMIEDFPPSQRSRQTLNLPPSRFASPKSYLEYVDSQILRIIRSTKFVMIIMCRLCMTTQQMFLFEEFFVSSVDTF
jgi:hypothetical protein